MCSSTFQICAYSSVMSFRNIIKHLKEDEEQVQPHICLHLYKINLNKFPGEFIQKNSNIISSDTSNWKLYCITRSKLLTQQINVNVFISHQQPFIEYFDVQFISVNTETIVLQSLLNSLMEDIIEWKIYLCVGRYFNKKIAFKVVKGLVRNSCTRLVEQNIISATTRLRYVI